MYHPHLEHGTKWRGQPTLSVFLTPEYEKLKNKKIGLDKMRGLSKHYKQRMLHPHRKLFGTKDIRLCFKKDILAAFDDDVYYKPESFTQVHTFCGFDDEYNFVQISIPTKKTERTKLSESTSICTKESKYINLMYIKT